MLTKEQIDRLFDFCKRHHVHHYDVQVELVDHLANAIEEKMNADKHLSFETALTSVHAAFGVLGFAGVVNARSAALGRQYVKLEKKLFFSYFTPPKIAMTVCLFLVLMLPLKFFDGDGLSTFSHVVFIFLFVLQSYFSTKSLKRVKKQKKHLLLTQVEHYESWLGGFYLLQFFTLRHYDVFNSSNHLKVVVLFAFMMLISIVFLVSILAYRDVTNQTYDLAKKQYPEVFETAG